MDISPFNSVTYVGMRNHKNDINDQDYELCCSCAMWLKKYLAGEAMVLRQKGGDEG